MASSTQTKTRLTLVHISKPYNHGHVLTPTDGPVFNRIKDLRDWIDPDIPESYSIERTPIGRSDAANLRLFLDPESTYLAFSASAWTFDTNIQDRSFRAWLRESSVVERSGVYFRHGYQPNSLALGPRDMFCWIADADFKVNKPFRQAFPGITAYLAFARREKLLEYVVCSPELRAKRLHRRLT